MIIDELYNLNLISIRALNVCRKNKILSLNDLIEFYSKFNTFIFLSNLSELNNTELIEFCENYFKENCLNSNEFNQNILNIYYSLNIDQRENFDEHYNMLFSKLSFKTLTYFKSNDIILSVEGIINFIFKGNIFLQNIKSKKVEKDIFDLRTSIIIYLNSSI